MVVVPWVLPSSAAARGSRPLFARLCGWVAEGLPSTTASVQTGVGPLARQQRAQGMEGRAFVSPTVTQTLLVCVGRPEESETDPAAAFFRLSKKALCHRCLYRS